jgi:hypothetical protein
MLNSLLERVQKNLVALRRSDEDHLRASIEPVHDVSVEIFRGATARPQDDKVETRLHAVPNSLRLVRRGLGAIFADATICSFRGMMR